MRTLFLGIVVWGIMACSADNAESPNFITKTDTTLVSSDCAQIKGLDAILAQNGPEIIIVGETHGMEEPPIFIKALTCHSLARGYKTALALEFDDTKNKLEIFLTSDGMKDDRVDLFEDGLWSSEFTDGRSSKAMFALINTARIWSQEYELKVISFQDSNIDPETYLSTDPKSGENKFDQNAYALGHEKGMAENILNRSAEMNVDKTIVLVGNLHARKSNIKFGDLDYAAMASYMPRQKFISLNAITHGGTAWNCIGATATDCKERPFRTEISKDSDVVKAGIFNITLSENEIPDVAPYAFNFDNHDGVVYIGGATASPPANKNGRIGVSEE